MTNFQICPLTVPCQTVFCQWLAHTEKWSIISDPGVHHHPLMVTSYLTQILIMSETVASVQGLKKPCETFHPTIGFLNLCASLLPCDAQPSVQMALSPPQLPSRPEKFTRPGDTEHKMYTFRGKTQAWCLWECVFKVISCVWTWSMDRRRQDRVSSAIAQAGLLVIQSHFSLAQSETWPENFSRLKKEACMHSLRNFLLVSPAPLTPLIYTSVYIQTQYTIYVYCHCNVS